MGTKADLMTLEGARRAVHELVDNLFNSLPIKPDGSPVDSVDISSDRTKNAAYQGPSIVQTGYAVSIDVKLARPTVVPADGAKLVVKTKEGTFTLAQQTAGSVTALTRFLIDVTPGLTELHVAEAMDRLEPIAVDIPISEVARRSNLLFDPYTPPSSVAVQSAEVPDVKASTDQDNRNDQDTPTDPEGHEHTTLPVQDPIRGEN